MESKGPGCCEGWAATGPQSWVGQRVLGTGCVALWRGGACAAAGCLLALPVLMRRHGPGCTLHEGGHGAGQARWPDGHGSGKDGVDGRLQGGMGGLGSGQGRTGGVCVCVCVCVCVSVCVCVCAR